MAKKSKKSAKQDNSLFSALESQLSTFLQNNDITPETLLEAIEQVNGTDFCAILNQNCYDYNKPDYDARIKPLHPSLEKIMKIDSVKGLNNLCDEAAEKLRKESPEQQREILVNAIFWILANQEKFMKKEYTEYQYNLPLFCILQLMIALDVTDVTDAIIELLRQDAYFIEYFFGAFEPDMSLAISKLCEKETDKLEEYMYETGRIPMTKCIVADAMVEMAMDNPMIRLKVIAWFARVFDRYSKILVYPTNIDHIVWSVTRLHAKELNPAIERLYTVIDVPYIMISSNKELEQLLDKGNPETTIHYHTLPEMFEELEKEQKKSNADQSFEKEMMDIFNYPPSDSSDEDFDEDYYYDEDEYDDSLLKVECNDGSYFKLQISLDNSPVEVSRTLIVPSNIRLSMLSFVLIRAMGWDGSHLSQFIKGKVYYCNKREIEEAWGYQEMYDDSKVALNEVLKRKGSNMKWEYDFGDSWMHTIVVKERIKTTKPMKIEVTEAKGACPPDDCGGVWGYGYNLDVLKDKKHPDYEDIAEWMGPRFNPTKVSVKALNKGLKCFNQ